MSDKSNQVEQWSSDQATVCLQKSIRWSKFLQSVDTLSGKHTQLEQIELIRKQLFWEKKKVHQVPFRFNCQSKVTSKKERKILYKIESLV